MARLFLSKGEVRGGLIPMIFTIQEHILLLAGFE